MKSPCIQTALNHRKLWTSAPIAKDRRLIALTTFAAAGALFCGYMFAWRDLRSRTASTIKPLNSLLWLQKADNILKSTNNTVTFENDEKSYMNTMIAILPTDNEDRSLTVITGESSTKIGENNYYALKVTPSFYQRITDSIPASQKFSNNEIKDYSIILKKDLAKLKTINQEVKNRFNNLPIHRLDYLYHTHFTAKKILAATVIAFAYVAFTFRALHSRDAMQCCLSATAAKIALLGTVSYLITYLPKRTISSLNYQPS